MTTFTLLPALLVLCLPCSLSQFPFPRPIDPTLFTNPCEFRRCLVGYECRLQHDSCEWRPCFPRSVCIPPTGSQGDCDIGQPVVNEDRVDVMCIHDGDCPDATSCIRTRFSKKCCLVKPKVIHEPVAPSPVSIPPRHPITTPLRPEVIGPRVLKPSYPLVPKPGRPLVPKPGRCPTPPPGLVPTCATLCNSDGDCRATKKCCRIGCAAMCQEPVAAPSINKPGSCPTPPPDPVLVCATFCKGDIECPGIQKCCRSGCAVRCLVPVDTGLVFTQATSPSIKKPGSCPPSPPGIFTPCVAYCTSDNECPDTHKCCSYGCTLNCQRPITKPATTPFIVKPGTCPTDPPGIVTACVEYCSGDGECPGTQKCCSYGCMLKCQHPITKPATTPSIVKPGTCPIYPPGVVTNCVAYCNSDNECPDTQKCCKYGCSLHCERPIIYPILFKPGSCTHPRPDVVCSSTLCRRDNHCPGSTKCCSHGCSLRCERLVFPPIVKAGSCPTMRPGLVPVCRTFCKNDNDCPNNRKCCIHGCAALCLDPVTLPTDTLPPDTLPPDTLPPSNSLTPPPVLKPGGCAHPHPTDIFLGFPLCHKDNDCPGTDKCCGRDHTFRCERPVFPPIIKPGSCVTTPTDLIPVCQAFCKNDNDCPNTQKCCLNGCTLRCEPHTNSPVIQPTIPPPMTPGSCPNIYPTNGCGSPCRMDSDCPHKKKCCNSQYCRGFTCVDPIMNPPVINPGICPNPMTPGCGEPCKTDTDCGRVMKCCGSQVCRGPRCFYPVSRPCPFYDPRCYTTGGNADTVAFV